VFEEKFAPSEDASMRFAEAAMEHDSVGGVGWQEIHSYGQSFVALLLQANQAEKGSKFGRPVIRNALLKSDLQGTEEGFGVLVGDLPDNNEGPIECIRGEIFLIKPGPQPEKVAKAPPKQWKASVEEQAPQSTSGSSSSSSSTKPGKKKAAKAPPKKRQAEEEQVHPQRTGDSSSSSTRRQKKQKNSGSTAAAAAAAAAPDNTAAKYAAAAQSEQDEALAELQTAQQEKSALDARADHLSTESTDLKAKLSAAEDDLSTIRTSTTEQLSGANAELNTVKAARESAGTVKAARESAGTELGQKAAAMTELGEQVRNVNTMLKETLSDEVSNTWSNFCIRQC
jgi:hypothetical protein